ncbi:MAG: short-subunit dehydrogenase [Oleiphilaceae bacterium]|jgi:short-subunit dehydrogenase
MNTTWKNKNILITGAGSGIGQALAKLFASQGAKLILTDINTDNLTQTAKALGSSVLIYKTANVTDKSDWQALVKEINSKAGHLDVLINNAGMTSFGFFNETSEALFNKVMDVNLNGVVMGCREMLPLLEKSTRGIIVNVASIFGLITMPMVTPYHASKFAVRGFTEALNQDMIFLKKNIDVICVMPGGIRTNIANYAETDCKNPNDFAKHFAKIARTTPAQAAKTIEKGMRKNTFRVLIGADAKVVDWLYRLLPTNYYKVSNRLLGVQNFLK